MKKPALLTEAFKDYAARLDWRWQRALALFSDNENPVVGFDDKYVIRAYKYLDAFESAENISQRQLLRRKYPAEHRVYDYHLNPDKRRLRLQALSLCEDLTQDDVAKVIGEEKEVVDLYEKFFFDVRSKTQDELYNQIFTPAAIKSITDGGDCDLMWKFVALEGGFRALQTFFHRGIMRRNQTDMFFSEMAQATLARNFGIAGFLRPLNSKEDINMTLEHGLKMLELQLREKEAAGGDVPEAQKMVLSKITEAVCVGVMSPEVQLPNAHEPTVEQQLAAPPEKLSEIAVAEADVEII